ncbi:class I SAM-dependent methyltransferase [Halobacillus salinarum]|uniref:Class I SAM-dependent methyltransferase n=1 Tax=Halobacillus salinarum TaxID=2932257 RepID=A0ABY4EHE7_9BACI|nr:class I SAM-dependent methyltransferase [Halobacillus salinarum]UOQ43561.1 class I SAM-dependent methyltransferase [Halobacillus salinarum]
MGFLYKLLFFLLLNYYMMDSKTITILLQRGRGRGKRKKNIGGSIRMIPNELKTHLGIAYDQQAAQRDRSTIQQWKIRERHFFLQNLLKENKRTLLEVGAGPGKDSLYFQKAGLDVFATDLSHEMIKLCRNKGLKSAQMSFDELSFPSATFDSVWALNCLLHVPKSQLHYVLLEIRRVLKEEGLFYMGVYGGIDHEGIWEQDFHEPKRFFSFYTNAQILQIAKSYFELVDFHDIPKEDIGDGNHHFQGLLLRKSAKKGEKI